MSKKNNRESLRNKNLQFKKDDRNGKWLLSKKLSQFKDSYQLKKDAKAVKNLNNLISITFLTASKDYKLKPQRYSAKSRKRYKKLTRVSAFDFMKFENASWQAKEDYDYKKWIEKSLGFNETK